jgi:hypothetical protein
MAAERLEDLFSLVRETHMELQPLNVSTACVRAAKLVKAGGRVVTPGCHSIGYMDRTFCHQIGVFYHTPY